MKESPAGIGTATRVIGCAAAELRRASAHVAAAARTAPASAPMIAQETRSRRRREATTGAATPACEPACAIHESSLLMSCALCQRSSGSLARHVRTTRSRAGGVIGATVAMGGGSDPMIEEINDAWLVPAKAFRPVAIS